MLYGSLQKFEKQNHHTSPQDTNLKANKTYVLQMVLTRIVTYFCRMLHCHLLKIFSGCGVK